MKIALFLLASFICHCLGVREECSEEFVTVDYEGDGYWQGRLLLVVADDLTGWQVALGFSAEVDTVYCSLASVTGSGTEWSLSSFSWDEDLHAGTTLEVGIVVHYSGAKPAVINLAMNDQAVCSGGAETTTSLTPTASTASSSSPSGECDDIYVVDEDEAGYWQGRLVVTVPAAVSDWELKVTFSADVDSLDCSLASVSGSGRDWSLLSYDWDGELEAGTILEVGIIVHYSGSKPSITGLSMNNIDLCSDSTAAPTSTSSSPSDDCTDDYAVDVDEEGMWQGRILVTPPETLSDWTVTIQFSADVDSLDCSLASVSGSGSVWTLKSYEWDSDLEAGVTLEIGVIIHFSGAKPSISGLSLNDLSVCSGGSAPTTSSPSPTGGTEDCDGDDYLVDVDEAGTWQGRILLQVPETVSSWEVKLHFTGKYICRPIS